MLLSGKALIGIALDILLAFSIRNHKKIFDFVSGKKRKKHKKKAE